MRRSDRREYSDQAQPPYPPYNVDDYGCFDMEQPPPLPQRLGPGALSVPSDQEQQYPPTDITSLPDPPHVNSTTTVPIHVPPAPPSGPFSGPILPPSATPTSVPPTQNTSAIASMPQSSSSGSSSVTPGTNMMPPTFAVPMVPPFPQPYPQSMPPAGFMPPHINHQSAIPPPVPQPEPYPDLTTFVNMNPSANAPSVDVVFNDQQTCPQCGKSNFSNLRRHQKIHRLSARFQCQFPRSVCNFKINSYNRSFDFKRHLVNKHFKFDDRKLTKSLPSVSQKLEYYGHCPCGWHGSCQNWLETHILVHPDDPQRCPYYQKQ